MNDILEDQYMSALNIDQAISHAQARQQYRITQKRAGQLGIKIAERIITRTINSSEHLTVKFHVLDDRIARMTGPRLRHLAGAAAMRHEMRVPPHAWQSAADAVNKTFVPDAICLTPAGKLAIEYDAGSYTPDTIRKKMLAFAADYPAGQVWGADSPAHVERLKAIAAEIGVPVLVILTNWLP